MAGKVKDFKYQPVVEWLVADLTRHHGVVCGPAPYVFARFGICGSGGPHYHRRDWEPVYAFAKPDSLPLKWSDNKATGKPCTHPPGGAMSNRNADGQHINDQVGPRTKARRNGQPLPDKVPHPNGRMVDRLHTKTMPDGTKRVQGYNAPAIANSGNIIRCKVGGGRMGSPLAHENEAPMPESLAAFFVRSFVPPGGTILDPWCGSGTTCAVAVKLNRQYIGLDIRQSQIDLTKRRLKMVQRELIS